MPLFKRILWIQINVTSKGEHYLVFNALGMVKVGMKRSGKPNSGEQSLRERGRKKWRRKRRRRWRREENNSDFDPIASTNSQQHNHWSWQRSRGVDLASSWWSWKSVKQIHRGEGAYPSLANLIPLAIARSRQYLAILALICCLPLGARTAQSPSINPPN